MNRDLDAEPFWRVKSLTEMTKDEWESLCDGCAKCCLIKLEDEDTEELVYTDVVCNLLDCDACRCTDYPNRSVKVPDCVELTPDNVHELSWMPPSCAYRLIAEGEDLPFWHPLVSGEEESVHRAGASVRGKVIREADTDPEEWEDRVVSWPEEMHDD